jgi:protein SMG7
MLALSNLRQSDIEVSCHYWNRCVQADHYSLASQSSQALQYCQFVLELNVRMIQVLADFVVSELQDLSKQTIAVSGEDAPKEDFKSSVVINTCIPLLRVSMFWLAINIVHVTNLAHHFEGELVKMYRAIGGSLTTILAAYGSTHLLSSVPYMLPEDLEMQGCKVFDDHSLEPLFDILRDEQGHRKPHWQAGSNDLDKDANLELLGRALDILKLGFFLSGLSYVPLAVVTTIGDGRQIMTVRYEEPGTESPDDHSAIPVAEPDSGVAGKTRSSDGTTSLASGQAPPLLDNGRVLPAESDDYPAASSSRPVTSAWADPQAVAQFPLDGVPGSQESDADFEIPDRLLNMVGEFLAPPESEKRNAGHATQDTSSFGTHTSTADEIWNQAMKRAEPSPPMPGSASGKGFPSLPWGYFLPPTPTQLQAPSSQQQPTKSRTTQFPPPQAASGTPGIGVQGVQHLDDPFAMRNDVRRYNSLVAAAPEGSAAAWAEAEQYKMSSKGLLYQQEASRGMFRGYAATGLPRRPNSGNWTTPSPETALPISNNSGNAWGRLPTPTYSQPQPIGPPSMHFSGNTSSLPPVNSPWGLRNAQTVAPGSTPLNPAFGGLPASDSGGSMRSGSTINPGLTHNGITYNGTTAYGRGNTIAAKDDPTHFKNTIKTSGLAGVVAEADEYDRKVLASALEDDKSIRRS